MKNLTLLAICAAVLLSACDKRQEPAKPAATPAAPAASAPAAPAASTSIGIAACDDYLNKYEACVKDKVPEAARAQFKQSLDQARDQWKKASTDANAKAGLEQACKQATDAAKQAMQAFGCQF